MSESIETVIVKRPDHPDGQVTINKSDMQPGDVLAGSVEKPQATDKPPRKSGKGA